MCRKRKTDEDWKLYFQVTLSFSFASSARVMLSDNAIANPSGPKLWNSVHKRDGA